MDNNDDNDNKNDDNNHNGDADWLIELTSQLILHHFAKLGAEGQESRGRKPRKTRAFLRWIIMDQIETSKQI